MVRNPQGAPTASRVPRLRLAALLALALAASCAASFAQVPEQGVLREQFNGIGGSVITALTTAPNYPFAPDVREYVDIFEGPTNAADSYGTRMRGYVVPPTTGDYTFYIAADDWSELWLSTDEDPAKARRIAYTNDWTDPRQWDKFETQMSESIRLEAGKLYYIEAIQKEGSGGDNLAVGWDLPDGTEERPIPGNRLRPYVIDTSVPPPPAVTDLAAATISDDVVELTWTSQGGAGYLVRYSLNPIDESNWAAATGASGAPRPAAAPGTKETLQVSGLEALQAYYFAVRPVTEAGTPAPLSNVVLGTTRPLTLENGVLMERYDNIGGTSIDDNLRTDPKFPDSPDFTDYLSTPETPTDALDNYGVRLRGYLLPPVTGDYILYIAGDDNSELWLSTDEDPANIEMIANVLSWTNSREWEKEENQTSAPVRLQAGRRYYFEALMKEGTGGDNLAVGWDLPDGTQERPIPTNRVAPFIKTAGAFGRLRGIVTGGDGKPLANAVVTHKVGSDTWTMTTDASGTYSGLVIGGAGQTTVAFPRPWETNTLAMDVTVPGNEVFTQNFAFNLSLPPFIPTERDAALSDDFSGGSLDAKWTSEDIGDTDPGETQVVNGQLVVTANGADIWDGGDHFRFTYQEVEGDFTAVLHILTVPTTDGWSKSGIMARESTDYQSLHSFVAATRDNGLTVQGRINFVGEDTPENISTNGGTFVQNTGYWVKLIRKGQTFTGFKSADGVETTFIRTDVHPNLTASRLLLGHAVTSHSVGNLGETIVDDFIVMRGAQEPTAGTAPPPGVKGDVDGNGQLAILDVVTALRIVAGLAEATPANLAGGDLNANGRIEITEVVQILRAVAGLAPL